MHDKTKVGLVEAHAQRGGRHKRLDAVVEQIAFGLLPLGVLGAARVRRHPVSRAAQVLGHLLGRRHRERVDDPGSRQLVKVSTEPGQPVGRRFEPEHAQPQALPIERTAQHQRVVAQLFGDVGR